MLKYYKCKITPLQEYFLGGETTFDFWGKNKVGKSSYYISSEKQPTQSTLNGMLRYLALKKANLLSRDNIITSSDKERQSEIIGNVGFTIKENDENVSFGRISSIGPLYIVDDHGHRYIPTPKNHKCNRNFYTPFVMKSGFCTETGNDTILPIDYVAKTGITSSFVDIDSNILNITDDSKIFNTKTQVGIAKGLTEDGFFKRQFTILNKGYSFEIHLYAEEDTFTKEDVVFLGQGKSAFSVAFTECPNTYKDFTDFISSKLPQCDYADVYYVLSDSYIKNDVSKYILYSIVEKKFFRYLTDVHDKNSYVESRKKSSLYQFIKAGSVFYVKRDQANNFENEFNITSLRQVGFNCILKCNKIKN